jgi:DUF3108-like
MKNRFITVAITLIVSILILSSCNLPKRQPAAIPTLIPPIADSLQNTPTSPPLCGNPYSPSLVGDLWEYSGTNSLIGDYTRTDSISSSTDTTFTQTTTISTITYTVPYDCSTSGIRSVNPVQQYAGALLNSPNSPVIVNLTSNTGTSLPATINPGDTWQQSVDFEASSPQLNVNGRFVFDYTAVGSENVTVTAGTYNSLRVNTTIRIEVTGLHILAGTYMTTLWLAPEVGLVKSDGTSHVNGFDFSDSMQLTSFSPAP